jgi:hypothetical protein
MERPVFLQSTWLRSRGTPNFPMRYQFVVDLLEQLTLCKYKARPHWVSKAWYRHHNAVQRYENLCRV